jgi:hypothetical protein
MWFDIAETSIAISGWFNSQDHFAHFCRRGNFC